MDFRNKIKTSLSKLKGGGAGRDVLHPADILAGLKRAAEREKKHFKEKTFVPEHYTVYLSTRDISLLNPILESLKEELVLEANAYFEQKGLKINAPGITVEIEERLVMQPGDLEVAGRFQTKKASKPAPSRKDENNREEVPDLKIRLLICPHTPREVTVFLEEGIHVLGRGRSADVIVTEKDPLVSKTHCSLQVGRGAVSVQDLRSANGTILNNKRVIEPKRLESGDRLLLGNTEIKVLW